MILAQNEQKKQQTFWEVELYNLAKMVLKAKAKDSLNPIPHKSTPFCRSIVLII